MPKTVVRRVIAVLQKLKAASDYGGERRCQQARGKRGRGCTSSMKKHLCVTHG